MLTFFICLFILIIGYFLYGSYVEKVFGVLPKRVTPAFKKNDGIDYIPLPSWKVFMIQFLNIAGLGPIFGAILGAKFGPIAFLWITFGAIFMGGVHDYFSGMLSVRHNGLSVPEIVGEYLGPGMMLFMRIFSIILLVLVGVVFISGPAKILHHLTGINIGFLSLIIFTYYLLATLLPIDKVIGKVYPFFGATLFIMALSLAGYMIFNMKTIPEITLNSLKNMHIEASSFPMFPCLFITIACGAISGFHSTQSPLMGRCLAKEKDGKPIFFGAMIVEGIVALIWAAASMAFFNGDVGLLNSGLQAHSNNAAWIVNEISNNWLGTIGGLLAIIGVVACPITSGDTAFRSTRLIIADFFNLSQKEISKRLLISIPLFIVAFFITKINFGIIWRYFGWANQTLAMIFLWTTSVYLAKNNKNHYIASLPAVFMTAVIICYLMISPEGFKLPHRISYIVSGVISVILFVIFLIKDALKDKVPAKCYKV